MRLQDRLANLSTPETQWGIWADAPFTADSESRIGQTQFENGGLLDEKEFVGTLYSLSLQIEEQIDEADGDMEYQREIAVETLLDELEAERLEAEHLKCQEEACTCGTSDIEFEGCDCPGYCSQCQTDFYAYHDNCPVH